MSRLLFTFPLLMVALIAIAIYVQVTSSTLSLPISTGTTVLTILLPLFAVANIFYTPVLNRLVQTPILQPLLLPALHVLQGGLTIIIATLAAQGLVPGPATHCELDVAWQALWHTRDGRAIERIQNTFNCCGFNKIHDRTWPKQNCPEIYHRSTSCGTPWAASMQRTSGLQFAVVVVTGIIQLAHLVYLRQGRGRYGIDRGFKRVAGRTEAGESGRLIEEPYHDGDDSGVSVDQSSSQPTSPTTQPGQGNAPHRVEPSGLGHDEANEWRS